MIIYPAIDIRDGKAVRLVEGDFARETVFDTDPIDAAQRWAAIGAAWIHVVDLDGARAGRPGNTEAIRRIRDATGVKIQVGGGLRTISDMESTLALGIDRLVLGSIALSDPPLVEDAVRRWGRQVAVGLDARDGRLAANGWVDQTDADAVDVACRLDASGVETFVFTDIERDGRLAGPNLDALARIVVAVEGDVIASGGVASLADIHAIRETGAAGAIVGRALYDGTLDLREVLSTASREDAA